MLKVSELAVSYVSCILVFDRRIHTDILPGLLWSFRRLQKVHEAVGSILQSPPLQTG